MTILWCGGEDVDFPNGKTGFTITSEILFFRSAYSRSAIYDVGSTWVYTNEIPGNELIDAWVSFYMYGYPWTVNKLIVGLSNGSTTKGVYVGSDTASATKIALYTYDGSTKTKLAAEAGSSIPSTLSSKKIDIEISGFGGDGEINVYVNGNLVINYSGAISISGISGLNTLTLAPGSGLSIDLSEFIIADEDTRLMSLKTIAPSAAGDSSTDWTGAYTDIDEVTLSDADKIYSSTADADFQCNLTGMPTGTFSVEAVKVGARCVDGSGSKGIALGIKSGGTVNVGSTETCSGYWQTKERLMTVNPVTGVAFTPADIEALQINLRAKAL